MDSAYLHNSVFNIEMKRRELEQQKLNRDEILRWFENNYRVFSKKSAFTCLCCNKPVNMGYRQEFCVSSQGFLWNCQYIRP